MVRIGIGITAVSGIMGNIQSREESRNNSAIAPQKKNFHDQEDSRAGWSPPERDSASLVQI